MAQPFNNAVMTNSGAKLLTRAQAGGVTIKFTRMAVGNGNYTEEEKTLIALQARDNLKNEKNTYSLSNIEIYSEHSVKVTALITNQNPVTRLPLVDEGYYINEVGLFAKPDGGGPESEVLYSIAITAGDNGDFMPPYNGYNPAQIIQDFFVTVDNSATVTINTAGAAVLKEDVEKLIEEAVKRVKAALGAPDEYNPERIYKMGDYCMHDGVMYKCIVESTNAEEWNPDHWEQTNLVEDAAGNIQRQIGTLEDLKTEFKENLVVAINELFSRKVEVVDPMLATQEGFVADALKTREAIQEVNENFGTATNMLGEVLVAFGKEIPDGTSLTEMIAIVKGILNPTYYMRVKTYANGMNDAALQLTNFEGLVIANIKYNYAGYSDSYIQIKYVTGAQWQMEFLKKCLVNGEAKSVGETISWTYSTFADYVVQGAE